MNKKLKNTVILLICVSIMIGIMTACSSGNSGSSDYKGLNSVTSSDMYYSESSDGTGLFNNPTYNDNYDNTYNDTSTSEFDELKNELSDKNIENIEEINYEKLVYNASIDIEVMEFDEAISKLRELISKYNGIIQSDYFRDGASWSYYVDYGKGKYREREMQIRIPTLKYEEFIRDSGSIGHITSQHADVTNISQQYYDTKAYLESYQNQLKNLQDMYSIATTIEEMMKIEQRIADVQAQILSLTTEIKSMDMDVAYSTIDIHINEVVSYSDEPTLAEQRTFWDRLIIACNESWVDFLDAAENFLFWLIYNIWGIIIWVFIIVIIIKIWRKIRKNPSKPKNERKKFKKLGRSKSNNTDDKENQGDTEIKEK